MRANSSLLAAHSGQAGVAKPASLERRPAPGSPFLWERIWTLLQGEKPSFPFWGMEGFRQGFSRPGCFPSSHPGPGSLSTLPPAPPTLRLPTWEKLLVPKTQFPGPWAARLQAPFCLTAGDGGPGRSSAQICVNEAGPQLGVVTQPRAHGCQVLAGFWFFDYSAQVGTYPGLL